MDFGSIESFIGFLETLPARMKASVPAGLDEASRLLQKEAKDSLGHYQEEAGEFVAWRELSETTMRERLMHGFSPDEPLLVTGTLRDHIYRTVDASVGEAAVGVPSEWVGSGTGTGHENPDHPRDIGEVALAHEFGVLGHIPPRSFLGRAAAENHDKLVEIMVEPVIDVLRGKAPRAFSMPDETGDK